MVNNPSWRSVDPYQDTGVIDERGPRTNQAIVGVVCLVAYLTGLWPLVALVALQLGVGLFFGRRFCLACRLWFDVLQRRLGEGRIEDARAPRFANILGLIMLSGASLLLALGYMQVGWILTLIVAALALLAAATGLCLGCLIYRTWARLTGTVLCDTCHVSSHRQK